MKNLFRNLIIGGILLAVTSCSGNKDGLTVIDAAILKDKIAGGWAGKMIGVTYGAPTEFRAQGKTYDDSIKWKPDDVKGSMWQDDIYVQLTFMMTMDKYGIDAPLRKFHEMFAKAGYPLWHANVQARKNYYDSLIAPLSCLPENNIHADDIDFQIESDYIGFMTPGMPQAGAAIAQKIGHIMNYGDGVYGGIFVAALYSKAFFCDSIPEIVEYALKSIPAESDYYKIVKDVIKLHNHYPADWRAAWNELQAKWDEVDICGAGSQFNIDAKFNGAFIVMGLLYGEGDPLKTMEISTRCGQDSDCNPSNAMAVLGVIKGFRGLPAEFTKGVSEYADSLFMNTDYSFNKAVENTYGYALKLITEGNGVVKGKKIGIKLQEPVAPEPEVSFPNVVYDRKIAVSDSKAWKTTGKWNALVIKKKSTEREIDGKLIANEKGSTAEFTFTGTGVSLSGEWNGEGGKADIFVDGLFDRTIDTYFNYNGQQYGNTSIWHRFGLPEGTHTVRIVVKGEKRAESADSKINLTDGLVFLTKVKKNENYRFSFE